MRRLVATRAFEKAFRKFVAKDDRRRAAIEHTLRAMEIDAFAPVLGTHKLSGSLLGLRACSCGYDCRIVFRIEKQAEGEVIILFNIGTHDEVY
jgi:mRNA interferase YafQ